jgi:DNA-binding response OmpR family regulator
MCQVCIIAEADPFIAKLLLRFVEECGFHAMHTQIGKEIIHMARNARPDVIILDPELPGTLRGWDVIEQLKGDVNTLDIPIILCSWHEELDVVSRIGELGGYLHKPDLHFEDFKHEIERVGLKPNC